jgi:hypothetical protein
MEPTIYTLLGVNLVLAVGFGLPLARHLAHMADPPKKLVWQSTMLFGIYLIECFAFAASMATNILSFGLAVVWGIVFGLWLRGRGEKRRAIKTLMCVAVYSCLPAVSFASVLVVLIIAGWPILTPEGGARFGVPPFVPWPLNTLTGFFTAVIGSALIGKTAVTTIIGAVLLH